MMSLTKINHGFIAVKTEKKQGYCIKTIVTKR